MTAPASRRIPSDVAGTADHLSTVTGRHWTAVNSVYYDCHVVSLAQLLPPRLYGAFLLVAGVPTIRIGWGGLYCRSDLDSEAARDVALLQRLGVDKHPEPVEGDLEATLRAAVRRHGHCVARVDSYYHQHFPQYFRREHRTNGHKVTIVDFNEDSYVGIDNVGVHTLVLRFDRDLFVEAIRSNLFHVYEKHDTLYRIEVGDRAAGHLGGDGVLPGEAGAAAAFLAERPSVPGRVAAFRDMFARDLGGPGIRRHAQLTNSYTTALTVERAYLCLGEAYARSAAPWRGLPDAGAALMASLGAAVRAWRMFKLLASTAQQEQPVSDGALVGALDRVLEAEMDTVRALSEPGPAV